MKVAGASRRSNVATSPRRDVSMPRRWVNQYNNQQEVTSRRGNVSTSMRDLPSIIKSSKGSEFEGDREAYERGHGIPEQQRHRLRRSTRDLYCFPFLDTRMMFFRLNIYIFLFSMF